VSFAGLLVRVVGDARGVAQEVVRRELRRDPGVLEPEVSDDRRVERECTFLDEFAASPPR
jgi:hypothetical protein